MGIIGVIIYILIGVILPIAATIIVGVAIANYMGLTGIVWWAFIIVFYLVIMSIIGGSRK